MRNKYSKDFEDYVKVNSLKLTKEQLRNEAQKKYDIIISKSNFDNYLYKRSIRCIDYKGSKARNMNKRPIGYERIKSDGMTLVKIGNPDKWEYKQRLMYKKYHNCELTNDDFIVFLNQDRTDFSKQNLARVSRKESSILSNQQMFSKNSDLTKTGILVAKLMIKAKQKTQ